MSLEFISKIDLNLKKDSISKVVSDIESLGYTNVYFMEKYSLYGFIHRGSIYVESSPPLFDLTINNSTIVLSVYGDLNDLEKIKISVSNVFQNHGLNLDFKEEGEEE